MGIAENAVDEGINNIFLSVGKGFTQLGIFFIILAVYFGAIIWALLDINKSKLEDKQKILWAAVCLLLGLPGVIIYYLAGRKK